MAGGRSGRRGLVLALFAAVILMFGSFLVWQGLDRADKWSSIAGVFLNLAAIALVILQIPGVRGRPDEHTDQGRGHDPGATNSISGIVGGNAIQARDIHLGHQPPRTTEPDSGEGDMNA